MTSDGEVRPDSGPPPVTEIDWLADGTTAGEDTEAETGTRTLVGSGAAGLVLLGLDDACVPCAGGEYDPRSG